MFRVYLAPFCIASLVFHSDNPHLKTNNSTKNVEIEQLGSVWASHFLKCIFTEIPIKFSYGHDSILFLDL
jgi:hypothetical protein